MTFSHIERPYYVQKIKPFTGKSIIKVLTGQRRVGKSYILKQISQNLLAKDPNANLIYIDKESYDFRFIIDDNDLMQYIKNNDMEQWKYN